MKKILLLLVALSVQLAAHADDDLSANCRAMRNAVQSFLKTEGYTPSINSTSGHIEFKKEGISYHVAFSDFGEDVYVETYSTLSTDDANQTAVYRAANKTIRSLKFVRCEVYDDFVSCGCTQIANTISQYKHTFDDFMDILSTARERLKTYYAEFEK